MRIEANFWAGNKASKPWAGPLDRAVKKTYTEHRWIKYKSISAPIYLPPASLTSKA